MKPLAIFAVGRRGVRLAQRIQLQLEGDVFLPERFRSLGGDQATMLEPGALRPALASAFTDYLGLVLIMPLGAAVRLLAPLINDKRSDPGVVVLDEGGRQAVAMLSSHLGGGNQLARQVASAVGGRPVITTAAEVLGYPALDLLAQAQGWSIEEEDGLTRAAAALIDGEPVGCYQDAGEEGWWRETPANLVRFSSLEALMAAAVAARVVISDRLLPPADADAARVVFRPKTLAVGVGCVRGATADEIDHLARETLERHRLSPRSVRELATIDNKRNEPGLCALSERYQWPVRYFSAEELAQIEAPSGPSDAVRRAVGVGSVSEPAALLAAGTRTLLAPKAKTKRVTVAVARTARSSRPGALKLVGLGPGAPEAITARGRSVLKEADAVVGYEGYLDQVRPWLEPKAFHGSRIGDEVERCRLAISLARSGQRVALVSSGDAGIYGMAGLVFELLADEEATDEAMAVEVVPGVSAAQAAAALLGAPLMSDYACISLSDLLTPWPVIEQRLYAAGVSDLVVALYNPASARRRKQLGRAQEILLRYRLADTPVGLVRNASRPGQAVTVTDLEHLLEHPVDMLTLVLIGNSMTVRVGDRLVTRRGYRR